MSRLPLFLALACLAGCAIPQPGMYGGSPVYGGLGARKRAAAFAPAAQAASEYVDEAVSVVTEPPGARVLVNEAPVGSSPLTYSVRRYWRGQPGYMTLDTVKIEALPVNAGECVQGGVYGQNNLQVPSPVRFVMNNCRSAAEYPQPVAYPAGKK